MKKYRKIIFATTGLILAVLAIGIILSSRINHKSLPDYNQAVILSGMQDSARVYYDSIGNPHIYAQNEHDLYMATGYIMACERMWQMDLLRRVSLGRLSEIFGDKYIETDLLLRSLEFSAKSKEILQNSPPNCIEAIESFAAGVNHYIERYKDKYPPEFTILNYEPEKWEAFHSINLIGYMAWDLKSGWNELIVEKLKHEIDPIHLKSLMPDLDLQKTTVYDSSHLPLLANSKLLKLDDMHLLGADILHGSNNWAVSGKKSKSGKPILANDMHLKLNIPGIWMQIHQVIEGELNVSGLILPGQPLVIVGHNDSIAWGMTNTYVDNLDYYAETIHPENPNKYLYDGHWKEFDVYEEEIISKGNTHQLSYRRNHRGPVVSEFQGINDKVLTIKWIGDIESNELLSIYLANRANNKEDFQEAFRSFKSIGQNIVYADKQGNIGLQTCAGIPIRKRVSHMFVLPGETSDYDWKGTVPYDSLPSEYNPERGYVSSANNKTVDSSYPYHIGRWYSMPYRIDRIREVLEGKKVLSISDFKTLQNDTYSKYAELFLKKTMKNVDTNLLTKKENDIYHLMSLWNKNMSKNSICPTIFEYWSTLLIKHIFQDEMGESLFKEFMDVYKVVKISMYNWLHDPGSVWTDKKGTPEKESIQDISTASFKEAIDYLNSEFGNDTSYWKWGQIHTITLAHPLSEIDALNKVFKLNRGPFSVGGSFHTVAPYAYPFLKPDLISHGASHRHIFDLNNWDNSLSVIPTGTSGIPASDFYCNQTQSYINGKYYNDIFSKEKIIEKAYHTLIITPKELDLD